MLRVAPKWLILRVDEVLTTDNGHIVMLTYGPFREIQRGTFKGRPVGDSTLVSQLEQQLGRALALPRWAQILGSERSQ